MGKNLLQVGWVSDENYQAWKDLRTKFIGLYPTVRMTNEFIFGKMVEIVKIELSKRKIDNPLFDENNNSISKEYEG
jgi:hypothetical protein